MNPIKWIRDRREKIEREACEGKEQSERLEQIKKRLHKTAGRTSVVEFEAYGGPKMRKAHK